MSAETTVSFTVRCPCGAELDTYAEGPWRAEDARKALAAFLEAHADHVTERTPDTHEDSPHTGELLDDYASLTYRASKAAELIRRVLGNLDEALAHHGAIAHERIERAKVRADAAAALLEYDGPDHGPEFIETVFGIPVEEVVRVTDAIREGRETMTGTSYNIAALIRDRRTLREAARKARRLIHGQAIGPAAETLTDALDATGGDPNDE